MSHWGKDILARYRLKKGLTQQDLAAALGQSVRWVAAHEKKASFDDAPKMHPKAAKQVADVLGVSEEEFRGEIGNAAPKELAAQIRAIETHGPSPEFLSSIKPPTEAATTEDDLIPILQNSPAGRMSKPRQLGDAAGGVPRSLYPGDPTAFGIVVEGDSMSPWVNNNDIVVASKAMRVEDGMPCVVCAREGFEMHCDTIKYVTMDNGRFKLVPENKAYRPMWVDVDQVWCYPIVLRIFRDYIRMGIKPMQLPVPKRVTGEESQVFPDYDGPQQAPEE